VQEAASDLQTFARYETQRTASSILLALNGMDHLPAREDLPDILAAANEHFGDEFRFQQSSLEEYFAALLADLGDRPLQMVSGELRDVNRTPGRDNRLLPHILSSRIYNKMQNERAQNLLEHWAEPWAAIAWLAGEDYPDAFLGKAWEWLLQNQPHDSIGGCSLDAVHNQMETRFAWSTEIAEEVLGESFEKIARRIDMSKIKEDEAALIVFNGLPWALEQAITVDVELWDFFIGRVAMQRWHPPAAAGEKTPGLDAPELYMKRILQQWYGDPPVLPNPDFRGLQVRPLDVGEPIPVQVESIRRSHVLRPLISGPASERRGVSVRASFNASLPPYGYEIFAVSPTVNPNKPVIVHHPHNVLENEYLLVRIAPNGTFSLEEKAGGRIYTDQGYFEDGGDSGDGYNYSYPLEDRVENTLGAAPRFSRLADGPAVQRIRIEYDWTLPESLDASGRKRGENRLACPLSVTLSLAQGSPRLDMDVSFDNHARDHRLRMVFPSDLKTSVSHASAQFDVVEHPIKIVPVPEEAWVEDAPSTFPQQDWMDLSDGKNGLCIIVRGLPEYEILDTDRREIAITLLRAVGFLGAGYDMQSASVGAGPHIATPEAQIQRRLTFSLSVLPHPGTWNEAEVWRQAQAFNNPPRAFTTGMDKNRPAASTAALPAERPFLSVTGRNVILSSVKKAETGEALIIRLYNPSDKVGEASIKLPFIPTGIQPTGLDEKPQVNVDETAIPVVEESGLVKATLAPGKIVSLRIDRK
jgi:alpha-mannosidase